MFVSTLAAAIAAGTAILYACLGELICERAGILNLGVEGMMLMGALAGFAATTATGSAWAGLVAALLAGGLTSLIHALLTITLQANQVVSGLALALFGGGLSAFLGQPLVGRPAPDVFARAPLPLLGDIPVVGEILFRQDALTYLSFLLAPALWFLLFRTRLGLHLRAAGENPAAADAMGVSVARLRYGAVAAGGMLAGLAGASISLASNPNWTENMTAGRGWIAIALVIFAGWNPLRAVVGAYLFGGVEALQFRLQTAQFHLPWLNAQIPAAFLTMMPYLFTIVALVLTNRRRRPGATQAAKSTSAPAALGTPYVREDRA